MKKKLPLYILGDAILSKAFSALCSCCFLVVAAEACLICSRKGKIVLWSQKYGSKSGFSTDLLTSQWRLRWTTRMVPRHPGFHLSINFWCGKWELNREFPFSHYASVLSVHVSAGRMKVSICYMQLWAALMPCWGGNNSCDESHTVRHGPNASRGSFIFLLWSLEENTDNSASDWECLGHPYMHILQDTLQSYLLVDSPALFYICSAETRINSIYFTPYLLSTPLVTHSVLEI